MGFNGTSGGGGNPRYGRDFQGMAPPFAPFPFQQPSAISGTSRFYYNPSAQPPVLDYRSQSFTTAPYDYMSANIRTPTTTQQPNLAQGQGPQPFLNREFRTCSMRNTTGGFGCEPGYNYFFPTEHTKIHVLKTGSTPPWQLPPNYAIQFHACHVPVNTTIAELMKGFGARNTLPKKNIITEVCPGGAGKWYKGIQVNGDNLDMMKKPIKDLGWDGTRTGLRGEKKVVYIYVHKN